tara:strand:+ start:6495 stop:7430 length:936 start_codon:yes stop_codon:yes gene_type:complete
MAYSSGAIISGGLAGEGTRAGESFATEVWGNAVETAIKEKLVLANLCNDISSFASGQGEKIHLPKIDQVTVGTKGEGAISWADDATDADEEYLDIDQHKYAGVILEDVIKIQSNFDMMSAFANELGFAVANAIDAKVDSTIINSFKASGGAINKIDVADSMGAEADWDTVMSSVLVEDVVPSNWTVVLAPSTYANLANLSDLALGTQASPLGASYGTTGKVGTVYGMNVMVSQNVTTAQTDFDTSGTDNVTPLGYVVHKSSAYIAFSQKARLQTQYDVDYLGTKLIVDSIYGTMVRNSSTASQKRAWLLHT